MYKRKRSILSANTMMAKLTNHFQRTKLIISSTNKHYLLETEDDFITGNGNVSRQHQFFSELPSPGRSPNTTFLTYNNEVDLISNILLLER